MSERSEHQYAAVLFADIVGYTSLMQSDEQEALIKLQNFKKILETKIPSFNGKIIQFYGDGCLVTFDNSLDSLKCAEALQIAFQASPTVPVRIGLHEGEVVFEGKNIFGHTVNITSRIESMGIAGAILMTSAVKNSIKNNRNFKLEFLGKFKLKNVSDLMSIYALANQGITIPKRSEMKGMSIHQSKQQNKFAFLKWLIPSLIALILGFFLWKNIQTPKIDTQILKERIAVLPFTNNTNNPNLDILGNMASDWINTGLMGLKKAEIVSPFTVRTHQASIGILDSSPTDKPSFAELTGAKNLITGAYYKVNNELIFKLEVVDAQDGQLRFSFKEIKGKENQKEILLTKLRDQVTGYWAARELINAKKITPPNFEAYELYLASLQKRGTEKELFEILALDSTFYLPRIHFLNIVTGSRLGNNKIHFDFLERHFNQLSEYEKAWFTYIKCLYKGEPLTAFNNLNSIRQKYPKDFLLNNAAANIALNGLNNPTLALAIYKELPLDEAQAKTAGVYWNERLFNMITCFIELGKLEEIDNLLATAKPNPDIDNNIYIKTRLVGALASNNPEKIDEAYTELLATSATKPFDYYLVNAELFQSNLVSEAFRSRQETDLIKNYNQLPPQSMNKFFMRNFVSSVKKENTATLDNLEQLPQGFQIGNLASAGQTYIDLKQYDKVPPLINALQGFTTCNYVSQIETTCAAAYYYMALLQAQTGLPEKAIDNLKKAKTLGLGNKLHRFQYSRFFTSLFNLPKFKALIEPIWPSANDGQIQVREVYQYHITPDNSKNVTANFQQKEQLQLDAFEQFFTIKLGLSNNYNNQSVKYLYQFLNIDKEWSTSENGEITVGKLPYGKQTLRIKAQLPDGRFSKEMLDVFVQVPRPFYLNSWFLGLLLIVIALGVYFWPS